MTGADRERADAAGGAEEREDEHAPVWFDEAAAQAPDDAQELGPGANGCAWASP